MPVPRRFDRQPPERDPTRINERIRVPEVRLIDENGQQVALVIDKDKLQELGGSKFMRIIDDLNGRLTTSAMIQMNREVDVDGQDEAVVAERFLRTAGLLGAGD